MKPNISNEQAHARPAACVSALWLYPVKSLAGIRLPSAKLTQAGLFGDREWMVVDQHGAFVSQRKLPLLATVQASYSRLWELRLIAADGQSIEVPEPEGKCINVRIWRDDCFALPAAKEVNQWLTQAVASATPLTLVRFAKQHPRATDAQRFGFFTTHFADAAPLLVTSETSLQALNTHLLSQAQAPVDMRRFRPNIVISGLPAFAEHRCTSLKSGSTHIEIALKDHCQRCSIITVDQTTGEPSHDTAPLRELAQINNMPGKPKAPAFGVNSVLLAGEGKTIRVGDEFEVLGLAAT